jgi:hypothetical protein
MSKRNPQFKLLIIMGTDAMQTDNDIVMALHRTISDITNNGTDVTRSIRDLNGNIVGSFSKK